MRQINQEIPKINHQSKQQPLQEIPKVEAPIPSKQTLREMLPPAVFEKSLLRSMAHYIVDLGLCVGLMAGYYYFKPMGLAYFAYCMFLGLCGWKVFMIGHDAGHGSFSNYPLLNLTVGIFSHGLLLVPFRQWAQSHLQHHLGHNSWTKDKSHAHLELHKEGAYFWTRAVPFLIPLLYGVFYLLIGWMDGLSTRD